MRIIRVIGPGRAGRSLSLALAAAGWEVLHPLGRGDDLSGAAEGVDVLAVCTPDDAIASVARAVRPVQSAMVLHCSGSLGPEVLKPHPRRAALHPLVALPDPETGARRLASGVTCAVDGDPLVREIVAALGARAVTVDPRARAAYHAAACIAANHVVALLGQVERVAGTAGLALDDFLPLAAGAVEDVARLGPRRALTGPAARGDWQTLARHLDALEESERPGYRAGAGLALQLTVGDGTAESKRGADDGSVTVGSPRPYRLDAGTGADDPAASSAPGSPISVPAAASVSAP